MRVKLLDNALHGLTREPLETRCAPSTWPFMKSSCIFSIAISHARIACTHRMRRIVADELTLVAADDESTFIARHPSADFDLELVLDLFRVNRRFTAVWLRTLPEVAFSREGIPSQRGEVARLAIVEAY